MEEDLLMPVEDLEILRILCIKVGVRILAQYYYIKNTCEILLHTTKLRILSIKVGVRILILNVVVCSSILRKYAYI